MKTVLILISFFNTGFLFGQDTLLISFRLFENDTVLFYDNGSIQQEAKKTNNSNINWIYSASGNLQTQIVRSKKQKVTIKYDCSGNLYSTEQSNEKSKETITTVFGLHGKVVEIVIQSKNKQNVVYMSDDFGEETSIELRFGCLPTRPADRKSFHD